MDEKLVRKALSALDGLQHQREAAIGILSRHLTSDHKGCEDTINQLLTVLDGNHAFAEAAEAEAAQGELEQALESTPETDRPLFAQFARER
jgi:hypothetical protein